MMDKTEEAADLKVAASQSMRRIMNETPLRDRSGVFARTEVKAD
ncbi:hypothetical protein [Paenibacillus sp. N3/727]|nr:hypothetical protein [Paenibacillus sp. N3/727]